MNHAKSAVSSSLDWLGIISTVISRRCGCVAPDIGDRTLLPQGAVQKLPAPRELFHALYCHFLRLADVGLRLGDAAAGQPSALAAFIGGDAEGDRQLCVRAMAAVYHEHAAAVGEHGNR